MLVRFHINFAGVMDVRSCRSGPSLKPTQRIRMPPSKAPEHHKRVITTVDDDDIDPQVDQQVREWFVNQQFACVT
jgi:hypothetical protein